MKRNMKYYKLCYIEDSFAYFTSLALCLQWGDDWDDAPYECNAGAPYNDKGDVIKVAYESRLGTPAERNIIMSVEEINKGLIAWLSSEYLSTKFLEIYAGTTLDKFIEVIQKDGGVVYLPAK